MYTMKSSSRLTRYLVIPCLAVSLSTVSLYPMLPALSGTMVGVQHGGSTMRACCCGTEEGRCCGMACCALAPPTKQSAPSSNDTRDDRNGHPFPLALKSAGTSAEHAGIGRTATVSLLGNSSGPVSLQARHVRLDV